MLNGASSAASVPGAELLKAHPAPLSSDIQAKSSYKSAIILSTAVIPLLQTLGFSLKESNFLPFCLLVAQNLNLEFLVANRGSPSPTLVLNSSPSEGTTVTSWQGCC